MVGRRLADWCADLQRHCAARGFRYLRVMTDEPLEGVALVALREAGILG